MPVLNISTYRFVALDDLPALRDRLEASAEAAGLKGTILVAHEGINLFMAGQERALHVARPAAAQQLAQVEVALAALHEQREARGHAIGGVGQRVHPDIDAHDGLDALAAAGLVELHRAEQVGQVGDAQRHLAVALGRRRDVVDAKRAVDDGELGVGTQVNESHAPIVGSRAGAALRRMHGFRAGIRARKPAVGGHDGGG